MADKDYNDGDLVTPELKCLGFEASQMDIPAVKKDKKASGMKGSKSFSFGRENSYGDGGGEDDEVDG